MSVELRNAFEAIGAQALIDQFGNAFEIDVVQNGDQEVYKLRYPFNDSLASEVMDVKPRQRHLVLDVLGWRLPVSARYLCGHDESHWFVAGVPINRRTACGSSVAKRCWRRNSGATIYALAVVAGDSRIAASTPVAFDGVNRDHYF